MSFLLSENCFEFCFEKLGKDSFDVMLYRKNVKHLHMEIFLSEKKILFFTFSVLPTLKLCVSVEVIRVAILNVYLSFLQDNNL